MTGSYTMYHCHTEDSLLDSCTRFQDYVDLAVANGSKALSISEHGKPLNWTAKWAACKKAGLRYIHSVEIYLTEQLEPKVRDNYHTVLMARNMEGLEELNELVSRSCDPDHFYYNNRLSFEEFLNVSDNIITTSACLASPLNKLSDEHPMYMPLARKYTFLEVQPHHHPEQVAFNRRLALLARQLQKPLIAGTDTHSSSSYKAECRKVLLAAKGKSYGDEDAFDLTYKTYDELVDMFDTQGALSQDEYMQAIENTNLLYDMTEDIELDTSIKYPILYGSREADDKKFDEVVAQKFADKLASGVIPPEQEEAFRVAIEEEMRVFKKLEMTGFMLSMSELITWCKEQGMAIGTARGSVGGSRVAYVADIIDLNPETWHTIFSRFCNEHRKEIGDIDIDCVADDRPKIFAHIVERFGRNKTARVPSFGTIQARAVVAEVGRYLARKWESDHPDKPDANPWALPKIAAIKKDLSEIFDYAATNGKNDEDKKRLIMESDDYKVAAARYPELFYYFEGMFGNKISQSVHPAGMVISPITLNDNFGTFDKDGENCLMLDMENIHDHTGLAKYDFLVLKTVQVIRDTCRYIGEDYPKSHEIDWNDQAVWADLARDTTTIFQFESDFASNSLRKFKPTSIFDMSMVTAAIRPSGSSYRDDLLRRIEHHNPSALIDNLLSNNLGYLVYQEDIIAFLQQVCGLSGGDADNVRRAIGRKQKDRLEAALPDILDGYCSKSDKPRAEAEAEAKEFLQIIEDASSYMFGKNHSIAYCMLGYICAYYRHYHPMEYITAFLNNAANEDDIKNGTSYANKIGIKVTMPRWGVSKSEYFYDTERHMIAKGISSIKYMNQKVAEEMYALAHRKKFTSFVDVLTALKDTSLNSRMLDILIQIDFFVEFGNQRELCLINEMFNLFKKGEAKQISRVKADPLVYAAIIQKHSTGTTKTGGVSKSYALIDLPAIMYESEQLILAQHLQDLPVKIKIQNSYDAMGYIGYISGNEEDNRKLYVLDVFPLRTHATGRLFGYSVTTQSVGTGKQSRLTVKKPIFDLEPIKKGDLILCVGYEVEGKYFNLTKYLHLY